MRKGIHPEYGPVVFRDTSTGDTFRTRSTLGGPTCPVVDVEVSSASHPFWTGRARVLDAEGRVEAFRRRYRTGGPGAERREGPRDTARQD